MKAFLEYTLGIEGEVRSLRVVKREDITEPNAHFKAWLDWVDPGEAYLARSGFLYVCVDLMMEA